MSSSYFLKGVIPREFHTDFQILSESRQYPITVSENEKFYVDISFLSTKSTFFQKISEKFPEGCRLSDVSRDELRILLESICPTLYNIYPVPLKLPSTRIRVLATLAKRFSLHMLLLSIERFCLSLFPDDAYPLLALFDISFSLQFSHSVQLHFLNQILSHKISHFSCADELLKGRIGCVIAIAWTRLSAGQFKHQRSFQEVADWIDCRQCRIDNEKRKFFVCPVCCSTVCKKHDGQLCDEAICRFLQEMRNFYPFAVLNEKEEMKKVEKIGTE